MVRNTARNLTYPALMAVALATAAVAIGGASATGEPRSDLDEPAHDDSALTRLEAADYAADAGVLFQRADIDKSGAIDAREYHALSIVTAELARLNRAVTISVSGEPRAIALSYNGKTFDGAASLSSGERARIDAVSARAFFRAAGTDDMIDADEFIAFEMERFADADRNANGVLGRVELARLAARRAFLPSTQA